MPNFKSCLHLSGNSFIGSHGCGCYYYDVRLLRRFCRSVWHSLKSNFHLLRVVIGIKNFRSLPVFGWLPQSGSACFAYKWAIPEFRLWRDGGVYLKSTHFRDLYNKNHHYPFCSYLPACRSGVPILNATPLLVACAGYRKSGRFERVRTGPAA